MDAPSFQRQQTGNAIVDRIQDGIRDVIAYLRSAPWTLPWLTNRSYATLTTDTGNIAAAAYATLVTTSIVTTLATGYLMIRFSVSGIQNTGAATLYFQVVVDGVAVKGLYTTTSAGYSFAASMFVRVPVVRGAHTILLQGKTNNASYKITAKTANEEHAHLYVEEAP